MKNIAKTTLIIVAAIAVMQSCKKEPANNSGGNNNNNNNNTTPPPSTGVGTGPGGSIVIGTDPSIAVSQGFFLNNWQAKTFTAPSGTQSVSKPSPNGAVTVVVDLSQINDKSFKSFIWKQY